MVGGLVSYNTGSTRIKISDSYTNVDFYNAGFGHVGGVVAFSVGAELENVHASGNINIFSVNNTGGLIGYSAGETTIKNSYNNTNISCTTGGGYCAGIVGYQAGVFNISNTYNTGNIHSLGGYAGGIVGFTIGGSQISVIDSSYNKGKITGGSTLGGIIGKSPYNFSIKYCYNKGDIISNSTDVGGIIGYGSSYTTIENCYNQGSIKGLKTVGGIAGNGDVENSYNYGNITLEEENDSSDITSGITSIGNVTGSINIGNISYKSNVDISKVGGILSEGTANDCYNLGNIDITYVGGVMKLYIGGIVSNSYVSKNNHSKCLINIPSEFDTSKVFAGLIIGNYDDKDLDVNGVNFNNKYVIKTNSVINNAVSSIKDIKNNNNEIDNKFGTKVDDFNVLDVLSVINKNNCYKINSNGDILFKD